MDDDKLKAKSTDTKMPISKPPVYPNPKSPSTAKPTTPKASVPKTKPTTPKATVPKQKPTTPKASLPKPKSTTPKASLPKPKSTTPKASLPKPKSTTPKASIPKPTTPKASIPKPTTPKASIPKPPTTITSTQKPSPKQELNTIFKDPKGAIPKHTKESAPKPSHFAAVPARQQRKPENLPTVGAINESPMKCGKIVLDGTQYTSASPPKKTPKEVHVCEIHGFARSTRTPGETIPNLFLPKYENKAAANQKFGPIEKRTKILLAIGAKRPQYKFQVPAKDTKVIHETDKPPNLTANAGKPGSIQQPQVNSKDNASENGMFTSVSNFLSNVLSGFTFASSVHPATNKATVENKNFVQKAPIKTEPQRKLPEQKLPAVEQKKINPGKVCPQEQKKIPAEGWKKPEAGNKIEEKTKEETTIATGTEERSDTLYGIPTMFDVRMSMPFASQSEEESWRISTRPSPSVGCHVGRYIDIDRL